MSKKSTLAKRHRRPNQSLKILQHLLSGGCLTALEGFQLFGTMRLAARIHELKDAGFSIANAGRSARHLAVYSYNMPELAQGDFVKKVTWEGKNWVVAHHSIPGTSAPFKEGDVVTANGVSTTILSCTRSPMQPEKGTRWLSAWLEET